MMTLAWGLSPFEIGLILVVALLLFGGKKLPELAKAMGRSINEFKRGMQEMNTDVPSAVDKDKTASQPEQYKAGDIEKPATPESKA